MGEKPRTSTSIPLIVIFSFAAFSTLAQTPSTPPAAQQQAQPHSGKVIFSRSTDENGQTTTPTSLPALLSVQSAAKPSVNDAERQAVTFTSFGLDVHLRPADHHIAVRALVSVRNDGPVPLVRIPLQISSSLNWESIRTGGKELSFQAATLNSDADHTGQLHEAAVLLPQPLLPGQSLELDLSYSGLIVASAQRLLSIGAPQDVAQHSDWDQISSDFVGLRGFGNVVWYPVSAVPVLLGDGARLFNAMGEHKLRFTGVRFRLRLTVEFPHGQAPTVAVINGHSAALTVTEPEAALDQSQEVAGVATADSGSVTLGYEAPSLFVAIRTPHPGENLTAWALPDDNLAVDFWTTPATAVTPFLQHWLGQKPRSQLILLDLPDPEDAPFETGSLLAAPLREPDAKAPPQALEGVLVHALSNAWLTRSNAPASPAWLDEGVATFMNSLWVEKQQGRQPAVGTLEAGRAALALAEPASPGQSAGQPLAQAYSPVYYRTKAAYVLWMLRDLAGDPALSAALRAYDPAVQVSLEKLIEDSANRPDLAWFFSDWVDADKGLPDLSIKGVFPEATAAGNWLVAIHIANEGYAVAEVSVVVRSGSGSDATYVTQRIRIPARSEKVPRILVRGRPTSVQVNDGTVPETQASVHITQLDDAANGSSSSAPSSR
jgi:hypothetical protein